MNEQGEADWADFRERASQRYDVWMQLAGQNKMPWSRVATGLTEAQAVAFRHHALFKVHIEKTPG